MLFRSQARLHAKSIDADIDPKGWMDEYHRKFADLIIQECIHAVENTNDRYRRDYFAEKTREHFGVES